MWFSLILELFIRLLIYIYYIYGLLLFFNSKWVLYRGFDKIFRILFIVIVLKFVFR